MLPPLAYGRQETPAQFISHRGAQARALGTLQEEERIQGAFLLATPRFICEQAGAGEGARLSSRATVVINQNLAFFSHFRLRGGVLPL